MKKYSLLLIPHGGGKIRKTGFPVKVFYVLAVFVVLFIASNLFFSVGYFSRMYSQTQMARLQDENAQLRKNIESMQENLHSVQGDMDRIYKEEGELRLLANLPPSDRDLRQAPIGGPQFDPGKMFKDGMVLLTSNRITADIEQMNRISEMELQNFKSIRGAFERKHHVLDLTPSIWPTTNRGISSEFGLRQQPTSGGKQFHEGVDILGRVGTPIYATADGQVAFAGWYYGYGKLIRIDHSYYETWYGHLNSIRVKPGDKIKRGQIIATLGATGSVTAPHVHYEVRVNGQPVDPRQFLLSDFAVQ